MARHRKGKKSESLSKFGKRNAGPGENDDDARAMNKRDESRGTRARVGKLPKRGAKRKSKRGARR